MVSDMLTIFVMTLITSGSICFRRVVGIASSSQDFEDMLFIMLDTGGSRLSHTAVKPDSRLARIFVAKFLCIIKLIIITG